MTKFISANNPRNCTASTFGCSIIAFVMAYTPPSLRRHLFIVGYSAALTMAQHPMAWR
jgi:hypothetical protein